MSSVRHWNKPSIEDAALTQLIDDAERLMRQEIDNVVRLQNTIKYSEKIRQEWEDKVELTLQSYDDEESESDEEGEGGQQAEQEDGAEDDDHSSTTSESNG